MKTRIISAIIMLPLLLIVYFGGVWLKMAVVAISIVGLYEFYKGFRAEGVRPSMPIGIASVLLLYIFHTICTGTGNADTWVFYMLWLFLVVIASMIYGFNVEERKTEDMAATVLGIVYVVFFFHFAVLIDECDYAKNYIWLVFIIAFGTDIFAYFTGVFLGKHKLCPKLSPKKTVEGLIGGLVTALIGMYIFMQLGWFGQYADNKFALTCACIAAILFSVIGDLVESMLKRLVGIKDSGKIFPGHGGMLDRIDSQLAAIPVFLTFIWLVSGELR